MEDISIVSSTKMTKASYDKDKKELLITFATGKTYIYYNVSEEVWIGFKNAPSKGSYFSRFIKGKYPLPNSNF
jgi:lysyl-tRNA synthetase class 2